MLDMKCIPDSFNDLLALILIFLIPGIWVVDAVTTLEFNGQVVGATIMGWGTVLSYYYRKKRGEV